MIFLQPDGWMMIKGYHPEIADYIKKIVPGKARRWFPKEKCWRIDGEYLAHIKKAVHVSVLKTSSAEAYRILDLQPIPTLEEVKQAYRQLVLKYHPDLYKGHSNMMILLSWAYETLTKELATSEKL